MYVVKPSKRLLTPHFYYKHWSDFITISALFFVNFIGLQVIHNIICLLPQIHKTLLLYGYLSVILDMISLQICMYQYK